MRSLLNTPLSNEDETSKDCVFGTRREPEKVRQKRGFDYLRNQLFRTIEARHGTSIYPYDKNIKLLLPLSDILAKTTLGKTALNLAKESEAEEAIELIEPMDRALREREAIKPPLKKKTPPKASNSTQPRRHPYLPKSRC